MKLIRGSLVALAQAVRGRRDNHHIRFFGIAISGFGIGIAFPRKNKTTPEEREEQDRAMISRKVAEWRLGEERGN